MRKTYINKVYLILAIALLTIFVSCKKNKTVVNQIDCRLVVIFIGEKDTVWNEPPHLSYEYKIKNTTPDTIFIPIKSFGDKDRFQSRFTAVARNRNMLSSRPVQCYLPNNYLLAPGDSTFITIYMNWDLLNTASDEYLSDSVIVRYEYAKSDSVFSKYRSYRLNIIHDKDEIFFNHNYPVIPLPMDDGNESKNN